MSNVIKLTGSNKKLMHQCGGYTKRANNAAAKGLNNLFSIFTRLANKKMRILGERLHVDTNKYALASNMHWDVAVILSKEIKK